MVYTIKKLATLAGVSVRTLHYYDEIGLVVPSRADQNGYRLYGRADLRRLQQVLFFRELRFPLAKIQAILARPDYDEREVLAEQRRLLEIERDRLDTLLATITKTLDDQKGATMTDEELYGGLTKQQLDEYTAEAKERWGEDAVQRSWSLVKNWTKADWAHVSAQHDAACTKIVAHMSEGTASNGVQQGVDEHYQWLTQFGEYSYEMYRGLGAMYRDDARFAATYAKYHRDLPPFIAEAIGIYCDTRSTT